jgi:hypothetical protein
MSSTTRQTRRRRRATPKPPSQPRVAADTPRLQEAEAMGTQANKLVDAGESQPAVPSRD